MAFALCAYSSFTLATSDSHDLQNKLLSFCATPEMNITKTETIRNLTAIQLKQDGYMMRAKNIHDPSLDALWLNLSKQALLPDNCMEFLNTEGLVEAQPDNTLLARLYFKFDRSDLTAESRHILNMVHEQLKQQPHVLQITGHTDSKGSAVYNKMLGLKRAYQTSVALQEKGIAQPQIYIQSQGEVDPITTNGTAAGRHQNRRVDITL